MNFDTVFRGCRSTRGCKPDPLINSQGIMQSPVVRKYAGIPDDEVIMICVAMGYPDDSFPANHVVSRRRPVAEVASFVGFAEMPAGTRAKASNIRASMERAS